MKVDLKHDHLELRPENDQDIAYIRDTLRMRCPGACVALKLKRDDAYFSSDDCPKRYYLSTASHTDEVT